MSRYKFSHRYPVDDHVFEAIIKQLNIEELCVVKNLTQIIKEDIQPLFPKLSLSLSSEDFSHLRVTEIIDRAGNLLPLGKGYIVSLINSYTHYNQDVHFYP